MFTIKHQETYNSNKHHDYSKLLLKYLNAFYDIS